MVRKYYDLGENETIRMTDKFLSNILRAVIKCRASIISSREFKAYYKNDNMNSVVFRLQMPEENKEKFEELTGFKLTVVEEVTGMGMGRYRHEYNDNGFCFDLPKKYTDTEI